MTDSSKIERIYLTYKTRMVTEARLIGAAKFYNALMSWYSFCLIFFSLSQVFGYYSSANATLVFSAASIGLFGLSIHISAQNNWERAAEFRSCYLKLKSLYESNLPETAKLKKYAEILEMFENQTEDDFDEMVCGAIHRGQRLYDSNGEIRPTNYTKIKVLGKTILRMGYRAVLVIAPAPLLILISSTDLNLGLKEKAGVSAVSASAGDRDAKK